MSSKASVMACALLLALVSMSCTNSHPARQPVSGDTHLTIVSYGGGDYQESHKRAFVKPFADITGVSVTSVTWNAEYGRLKAMVTSGTVTWDVVEVTAAQFLRGTREGLYEKLSVLPDSTEFLPGAVDAFGVANGYWGTVLAYNKERFAGGAPMTWRDFWNVAAYPGFRAMYDDPRGNLEMALLADGVEPAKLYPLDVDRAFAKLDEIRPHVRVWWTDGVEPIQLLMTESVVMATAWNTRIYASVDAQKTIGYSWEGAPIEVDYWVVPKGAPNVPLASRFILFASRSCEVGRQCTMIGYGPANIRALEFIPERQSIQLPTHEKNRARTFAVDAEWWSTHEAQLKVRWVSWKESK